MLVISDTDGFKDLIYRGNSIDHGTIIYTLSGNISTTPTRTSIQIGPNQHIEDELGQYVNHSCNPSVEIVGHNLISVKQINDGDSITFNYNESEDLMSNPFNCHCCNKIIGGKYY